MNKSTLAHGDDDTKRWYLNGQLHREDGPAIEYPNGTKMWYINDKRHREDGPAVEFANGNKFWYRHGIRHREDGPACFYQGIKFWYTGGLLHREDGPADERDTGIVSWWINGLQMTKEEFIKKNEKKKFTASEIASLKSYGIEVD
jgi:hypothetical protein